MGFEAVMLFQLGFFLIIAAMGITMARFEKKQRRDRVIKETAALANPQYAKEYLLGCWHVGPGTYERAVKRLRKAGLDIPAGELVALINHAEEKIVQH